METTIKTGDLVQDLIGHWMQVLEVLTPWRYRVQALTPVGTDLRPLGTPFVIGRSDLK